MNKKWSWLLLGVLLLHLGAESSYGFFFLRRLGFFNRPLFVGFSRFSRPQMNFVRAPAVMPGFSNFSPMFRSSFPSQVSFAPNGGSFFPGTSNFFNPGFQPGFSGQIGGCGSHGCGVNPGPGFAQPGFQPGAPDAFSARPFAPAQPGPVQFGPTPNPGFAESTPPGQSNFSGAPSGQGFSSVPQGQIPRDQQFRPVAGGSELVPANVNGNPSFVYEYESERTANSIISSSCQGTLVSSSPCVIATAAHCLEGRNGQVVNVKTADFGQFQALVTINPQYAANSRVISRTANSVHMSAAPNDVGFLSFDGPACQAGVQRGVPVVPVDPNPVQPGEDVVIASRWLKTTFGGRIRNFLAGAFGLRDRAQVIISGTGIKQGDSGGGLFRTRAGSKSLVGVLSSKNEMGTSFSPDSNYAAGSAIEWLYNEVQRLKRDRSAPSNG